MYECFIVSKSEISMSDSFTNKVQGDQAYLGVDGCCDEIRNFVSIGYGPMCLV